MDADWDGRMNQFPGQFVRLLLIGATALLIGSCKREERSFEMPASVSQLPEAIPYQNRVRPGPQTPQTGSTTLPASLQQLSHESYGQSFAFNAQALSDGQSFYEAYNCAGCHAHGGGGIGPPLMDAKWFYGAAPDQIYQSILQGRPNGMPSFRGRIADYQMWEIVAYVRSMSGQANRQAASGREDHMATEPPPNSIKQETPITVPEPATGPSGGRGGQ